MNRIIFRKQHKELFLFYSRKKNGQDRKTVFVISLVKPSFMKKVLLLSLTSFLFKFSSGQISKDNWLVGGSLAYTHSKQKTAIAGINGSSEVQGDLNGGYFVIDKLAAGVRTSIQTSKYKLQQIDNTTNLLIQRAYGFGPFIRYYILAPEKMLNFFGDAGFLYNINSNNSNSFIRRSLSSSLAAGGVVFLNKSIALEGLVSYTQYANISIDSEYSINSLKFKVGLQVHLQKAE